MHTEAGKGFLTDFARTAGEEHIDRMLTLFGRTVGEDCPGAGRLTFDGRLQALGFYMMAWDQHVKNFKNLLTDMKNGEKQAVQRQKAFYQWYNSVHHFPAGFIRDTYKKIFVQNALIRGSLEIGAKRVDIADYPCQKPIWALGGRADPIAPPLQAVGHLDLLPPMPPQTRLRLLCEAGHMGLFRSRRVLKEFYHPIADFLLIHSDYANRRFSY
jgi:poly-beta-hydroxyalkanoate depolymerase